MENPNEKIPEGSGEEEPNYFEMSDSEILTMQPPVTPAAAVVDTPPVVNEEKPEQAAGTVPSQSQEELDRKAQEESDAAAALAALNKPDDAPPEGEGTKPESQAKPELDAEGKPVAKDPPPTGEGEKEKKPEVPTQESWPETVAEYSPEQKAKAFEMMMGPIRANGKELTVRTPDEAVTLMKMGLNYTKKMQQLQPDLRLVTMLRNNKLDEASLSYLLDLQQGKPEAIQKLLADNKFDPMTIDAERAAEYVPGDHQVSDADMAFQAALEEVSLSPTGQELIGTITSQWDGASKQALYESPELLAVINDQKSNGIYDRIHAEIERQQTLGHLRGIPYIKAYYDVGQAMQAKGLLVPAPQVKEETAPQKQPIETRTVTPPPKVMNDEKAKAASPTQAPPSGTAKPEVNYLEESDADFLKRMEGRV